MLTIAHVTTSLKQGGAEEVLCSLVEQLDTTAFVSHVLYFHDGPHVTRLRKQNIHLHHIRGFICHYDPIFWWRLIYTLYRIKPDCIHALLWSAQCAARVIGYLLRIPVVTVYHNQASLEKGIRLFFDRATLFGATTIVAVSSTVAQSITNIHKGIRSSHITVIANGIDTKKIDLYIRSQGTITKTDLGIPATAAIVGSVGRLHPVKNHAHLLKAYALMRAQYPLSYLLIVGDGPEKERLCTLAQHLQITSQVIWITGKQAYPYYSLFDCFVLPSAQEGMSMALLEAHYFSCASVVAHDTQDHAIVTHEHNGLLVKPDDTRALAQAMATIVHNQHIKQKLGSNARQKVMQYYTAETMVKKYEQLFISCTTRKS